MNEVNLQESQQNFKQRSSIKECRLVSIASQYWILQGCGYINSTLTEQNAGHPADDEF